MKKLCLFVVIVMGVLLLCSCEQKTEYTMKELEDQIVAVNKAYDEKTKDLTDEEIEKQGVDILVDEAERQGLPVGEEITIRGKVYDTCCFEKRCFVSLIGDEVDKEKEVDYDKILYCYFDETISELMFLEQNENIVIRGVFCDKEKGLNLSKCKIVSPKEIDVPEFDCNVEEYYNDGLEEDYYYEFDIMLNGVVDTVVELDNKEALYEKCGDDELFKDTVERSKYLVWIKDDKNEDALIMWFTDSNTCKAGDKIALKTSLSNVDGGEYKGLVYADYISDDGYYVYE